VIAYKNLLRLTPNQILRLSQTTTANSEAERSRMVEVFGALLEKLARRTCRKYFIADQERDEVLAETYQQLFNPEIVRFLPRRGKPHHYFKGLVQNAARKIMAQLGSRRRKKGEGGEERASGGEPVVVEREPQSPTDAVEVQDTVRFIFAEAPYRIRQALHLIYWQDWSIQAAAAELGVSRFVLGREIQAFFNKMNAQLGEDNPRAAS
jgi:DNA-directed RNA polymerase specialized sigma24 family protein